MYVPFPLDQIALREPLPVNVWDPNGVLLLRRGEVIRDEAHRDLLQTHLPMVDEEEYRQWTFRYTAAIDRKLRDNERLEAIASVTRPMGVEVERVSQAPERPLAELWPDLHAVLSLLLRQGSEAGDFLARLQGVERRLLHALRSRVDDSLFLLVQMLHDRSMGYSASHALLCAVVCRLVSGQMGWPEPQRQSLLRASLTMNIGMSHLHDALAVRPGQPTAEERKVIDTHPLIGAQMLHRLGVTDDTWLKLVRHHHAELPPVATGAGTDPLIVMAQLLHLSDVFVARISPRAGRRGLPPHRAARDISLDPQGQPTPLGAAVIKTLGVYIPGSYVRLANGELAVVVRRGRKANAPLVFALVGRHGMPLGEPALRDTADHGLEVKEGIAADEVRVRIQPARLLARL
ncbi:HD-GYP domain-containing protein [Tepidicella baoligensis]|uniref:HD-GYP domain-containing protein n=1 Tax=Tepidicella baoligensis TaxID=2707016 RepID=UPI0015D9887B|nr:HD domain-containing phosphohydrolase [Tepidicella baoligensis]